MDQVVTLIQNVGVPISILVFLGYYFVKPLGGSDGVVATFFKSQSENGINQTQLMNEQRHLVSDLVQSIAAVGTTQSQHYNESTAFFSRTNAVEIDLLKIHSLLAKACQLEFENQEAKIILREVGEIVSDALSKTAT